MLIVSPHGLDFYILIHTIDATFYPVLAETKVTGCLPIFTELFTNVPYNNNSLSLSDH
jgi:hypothetical protein